MVHVFSALSSTDNTLNYVPPHQPLGRPPLGHPTNNPCHLHPPSTTLRANRTRLLTAAQRTVQAGPTAANSKVPAQRPTKEVSIVDRMGPVTLTAARGAAKRRSSHLRGGTTRD